MAHCVWALVNPEIIKHMCRNEEGDTRRWLALLIDTLSQEEWTRVLVTLWAIWHARRKAIHENQFQSPLSTHMFVERFIDDVNQSMDMRPKKQVVTLTQVTPGWITHPRGMMKVNVDAAVEKSFGQGSVAAVARSEDGVFLGAYAAVYLGKSNPEILEALACREAIALAQDINIRKVMIVSDYLSVVRSLQDGSRGIYAHIIREILDPTSEFEKLSFCHERRISNKEAHALEV
jgi:ribonuclease HI